MVSLTSLVKYDIKVLTLTRNLLSILYQFFEQCKTKTCFKPPVHQGSILVEKLRNEKIKI